MSTPSQQEVDALLGELDADFGKKPKGQSNSAHALNRAWHAKNTPLAKGAASYAKAQLENMQFRNYYDWERHRVMLLEEARKDTPGLPDLEWLPEARVTAVVHQRCSLCHETVSFVGNQYIRFRGRKRLFHDLDGSSHNMAPTVMRRVEDCDANLVAYGLPTGDPLPDLVDEIIETVPRCVGCIQLERKALDLWITATQPAPQASLLPNEPTIAQQVTMTAAELRTFIHRDFGPKKRVQPASDKLEGLDELLKEVK